MVYEPIEQLLNADVTLRDDMTRRWVRAKLDELSFVGLTSALISALFAAAFSWYNITLQPYTVRAVWYSGLLLSLAGISSAMQQSIALHRLSSNTNGLERVRNLLGYSEGGTWKARHLQIFMWQSAVMLLNVAIFLFILGLFIAILSGARDGTEDYRTVAAFIVAATFGFGNSQSATPNTTTKMGLLEIICIALLSFVNYTVGCPADCGVSKACLSVSPPTAVAFNLGQSYGTAALAFANGTLVNAARVDGSAQYIQLVEKRIYNTRFIKGWYLEWPGVVTWRRIKDRISRTTRRLCGLPSTPEVGILSEMIADLKAATWGFSGFDVDEVIISGVWPVIWDGAEGMFCDIHEAAVLAGVRPTTLAGEEEPRFLSETEAILTANGEETNKWRRCPGGSKNGIIENTFLISWTNHSLYTSWQCRECDFTCSATQLSPHCRMGKVNASQGLDSWSLPRSPQEQIELRKDIGNRIMLQIGVPIFPVRPTDSRHKTVLVAGEAASDPKFLKLVRRAVAYVPLLLNKGPESMKCFDDCPEVKVVVVEEPEFAAARGAALFWARFDGVTRCHDGPVWQRPFDNHHGLDKTYRG
ncbi:hypothetical protein V493_08562 [Pseudogymnoascus sp. VKM F-4281 (FW-2241)]|nr:hypothetical protein V493_08562 [Pseudogymnoascus sp. VKM F-4281 (FW-2241)]